MRTRRTSAESPSTASINSNSPGAAGVDALWDVLSLAGVATCILGGDSRVVSCNAAFATLVGQQPGEPIGKTIFEVVKTGAQDGLDKALRRAASGKELMQRFEVQVSGNTSDKRTLALSGSVTMAWGGTHHLVIVAEDITPDRQIKGASLPSTIEMNRLANQDALTGLANREKLDILLASSLQRAQRTGSPFAVLLCNLDGLARINDELGHVAGDDVLQWVATRLTHTLRHHDALARLGGDEFVVIAESVPDEKTAHLVANRLIAAISDPIGAGGREVRIGMTVGLTMANGRERSTDLLADADRAMHAAKRAGKGGVMSLTQVLDDQARQASDPNDLAGLTEFSGLPEVPRGRHFKSPQRLIETSAEEVRAQETASVQ